MSPACLAMTSRTLRLRSRRASRCSGVPGRPNIRSNTVRGLNSIGCGVVGELHEIVLMYPQLNPLVHAPM